MFTARVAFGVPVVGSSAESPLASAESVTAPERPPRAREPESGTLRARYDAESPRARAVMRWRIYGPVIDTRRDRRETTSCRRGMHTFLELSAPPRDRYGPADIGLAPRAPARAERPPRPRRHARPGRRRKKIFTEFHGQFRPPIPFARARIVGATFEPVRPLLATSILPTPTPARGLRLVDIARMSGLPAVRTHVRRKGSLPSASESRPSRPGLGR